MRVPPLPDPLVPRWPACGIRIVSASGYFFRGTARAGRASSCVTYALFLYDGLRKGAACTTDGSLGRLACQLAARSPHVPASCLPASAAGASLAPVRSVAYTACADVLVADVVVVSVCCCVSARLIYWR